MDEIKNATGKQVKTLEKEMHDNAKEGLNGISRPHLFEMSYSVYERTRNAFQELKEKYRTLVLSYRKEKFKLEQEKREHKFKMEEQKRPNPGNPNAGIILVSFNF
eukprot:Pgem_evm1s8376